MKVNKYFFLTFVLFVSSSFASRKQYLWLGFSPAMEQNAKNYNISDYANDSEIQKLLVAQNSLKKEYEHYKKVKAGEIIDETKEEAKKILLLREQTIKECVIDQSPLFAIKEDGSYIRPTSLLLTHISPEELLAWIDHHRVDKKKN